MKGEVFIVWGQNCRLAEAVAKELNRKDFHATVGGSDQYTDTHYLGQNVMNQMSSATRAIVLAQWPPEGSDRAVSKIEKPEFRPNLMFEWGYLCKHLPPIYLHVFLIDRVKRTNIPSDIQGFYCKEITLGNKRKATVAREIVTEFERDLQQIQIDPIKPLEDWHQWKGGLQKLANGDYTDDSRLAASLIHSIQPAYYNGEIGFLRDISDIAKGQSQELQRAVQVVKSACDYYDVTGSGYQVNFSNVIDVLGGLGTKGRFIDVSNMGRNFLSAWTEVMAHNYSGLCYRRMSENCDEEDKNTYLDDSIKSFCISLQLLKHIKSEHKKRNEINSHIITLWEAYINRNIGRSYEDHTDKKLEGEKYLIRSKELHIQSNAELRPRCKNERNELVYTQLILEKMLISVDISRYNINDETREIKECIRVLRDRKSEQSILWNKVFNQIQGHASNKGDSETLNELNKVKNI